MPDSSHRLRFGRFEVLPVQRRLLVDGLPVALGSRALDLLLALIEHRGRMLTKNELLDLVWPGLVVEEGNLKVQVSSLRKLIGAAAIATVPARGYRFAVALDDDPSPQTVVPAARAEMAAALAALPNMGITMIGRDDDLAALQELLRRHRLVTLTGAGGIGKTTLALGAARAALEADAEGHGVAWVELATISEPAAVALAVARALNVIPVDGLEVLPSLLAALQARPLLLVLDNAEHVIAGVAPLVQAVVGASGGAQVLVTSQAALKLPAERVYRLGSLEVPETSTPLAEALSYGAVALFAERGQSALRQFTVNEANLATVIKICRGLDGLALAIELAAARLPLLGLEGVAARLDERLRLLAGGIRSAPTRQQTLRAALDWSHALLSPPEMAVFRRLSVFVGGFSLELAAAVAGDDGLDEWAVIDVLGTLVERSLVAVDGADPPRYRLLESARAYAFLKLEAAAEHASFQCRHAQALRDFAEHAESALWTTPERLWLARCAPELDNLRAAIDWSTQHAPALAIALVGATFHLFNCLALLHESRQRAEPLDTLLATLPVPPRDAARFLRVRSAQMRDVSVTAQHELAMRSAQLYRESGDDFGRHETLYVLVQSFQTFAADARAAMHEMAMLERPDWPPSRRVLGKIGQSLAAYVDERMDDNRTALEAALPLAVAAGADRLTMVVLGNLADHVLWMGPLDEAVRRGFELTALLRRTRRMAHLPLALCNLANALLQQGAPAQARTALTEAFAVMRAQQWAWLRGFGDVYALLAAHEGRLDDAATLLGWADEVRRSRGARQPNEARCRAQALHRVGASMTPEQIERCLADGESLDPEQVFATALRQTA